MQKIKPKFEHLSQVQRTLQAAQNEVMQKPPISFAPMQARPLYSIAQEGTLKNIANEWRAHPEILTKSRALMVEALRHLNLSDEVVLAAMARVPRHVFVDEAFYFRAYDDDALPIGHQQTIASLDCGANVELNARGCRAFGRCVSSGIGDRYGLWLPGGCVSMFCA